MGLLIGEQSEEVGIDALYDSGEIGLTVEEIDFVDIHCEHFSLVLLVDEVLVEQVEVLQVIELHELLIVPAPPLDVLHEMRDRGPKVYHEVGHLDNSHHRLEELHVAVEVAVVESAHGMVVGGKDIHPLEDAAVLDDGDIRLCDVEEVAEALLEEENLKGERPSRDVFVVVVEIGVVVDGFKFRNPSIMLGEQIGKRGFPATYVSSDDDMHG